MMHRFLLALLLAVAVVPASLFGVDLDPAQEQEAAAIFESVLSPFCPGRLLRDCPSTAAHELKDKIRGMVVEGKSRADIQSYLFALYGNGIRSVPAHEGFGNVAWWAPTVFLLSGLGILGLWLRSKRAREEAAAPPVTPEMVERISRHLR